jgi:hypothetical protein
VVTKWLKLFRVWCETKAPRELGGGPSTCVKAEDCLTGWRTFKVLRKSLYYHYHAHYIPWPAYPYLCHYDSQCKVFKTLVRYFSAYRDGVSRPEAIPGCGEEERLRTGAVTIRLDTNQHRLGWPSLEPGTLCTESKSGTLEAEVVS